MVRPKIEFRIQRNGNSLQFFHNGDYCGSLPLPLLCALARQEKAKDTILQNIQDFTQEEEPKKRGFNTNKENALKR